jgi:hypothetical protein
VTDTPNVGCRERKKKIKEKEKRREKIKIGSYLRSHFILFLSFPARTDLIFFSISSCVPYPFSFRETEI